VIFAQQPPISIFGPSGRDPVVKIRLLHLVDDYVRLWVLLNAFAGYTLMWFYIHLPCTPEVYISAVQTPRLREFALAGIPA
jgi:hypothetical protein